MRWKQFWFRLPVLPEPKRIIKFGCLYPLIPPTQPGAVTLAKTTTKTRKAVSGHPQGLILHQKEAWSPHSEKNRSFAPASRGGGLIFYGYFIFDPFQWKHHKNKAFCPPLLGFFSDFLVWTPWRALFFGGYYFWVVFYVTPLCFFWEELDFWNFFWAPFFFFAQIQGHTHQNCWWPARLNTKNFSSGSS